MSSTQPSDDAAAMAELESRLSNPLWRLQNLYQCRKEGPGTGIPFRPRPEQMEIFRHMIERPLEPIFIIKSRRLGMSTGIGTYMVDRALFTGGFRGVLIDQKQEDATKKMKEILRFAVDSIPPEIAAAYDPKAARNDSELRIRVRGAPENRDSAIFATTGSRGGDCSMLHVSEFGPIAFRDPVRSEEIRTGAWNSARLGIKIVETTWMGGKGGDLWEMIKPILEQDPNARGQVYFFPWHCDPAAFRTDGMVTPEIEDYFRTLAGKIGKSFSREQKQWYATAKIESGIFVTREFPSTLEEAMSAPVEGSIYGHQITQAQAEQRMVHGLPVDGTRLVHTAWDLGSPQNTAVWYFQIVGREVRVIDCDLGLNLESAQRVAHMMGKGYLYGCHYLPHDAAQTERSGRSLLNELSGCGLQNIKVVPRTHSIWVGINHLQGMFSSLVFRLPQCADGVARLQAYHTDANAKTGAKADEPVHDNYSSHAADGLRTMAEAFLHGMLKGFAGTSVSRPGERPAGSQAVVGVLHRMRGHSPAGQAVTGVIGR